jgi:hypothetical protein
VNKYTLLLKQNFFTSFFLFCIFLVSGNRGKIGVQGHNHRRLLLLMLLDYNNQQQHITVDLLQLTGIWNLSPCS